MNSLNNSITCAACGYEYDDDDYECPCCKDERYRDEYRAAFFAVLYEDDNPSI